jgi:hypothetical protein
MPSETAVNQNVSFYPTDLAIVEAVEKRNGSGISGAIRFIIRDWQRMADPEGLLLKQHTRISQRPRRVARKSGKPIDAIPGVQKGVSE